MLITFDSELRLRQTLWRWKANSKLYNFVFHENFPIPTFWGSNRADSDLHRNSSRSSQCRPDGLGSVQSESSVRSSSQHGPDGP
jgi:hypothetical protein